MKILVSGSSGFIGKNLCQVLLDKGHQVKFLVRGSAQDEDCISTDGSLDLFEGLDAVIHLAGENIAKGFWTSSKKKKIFESRQLGTERLVTLLKQLKAPPKVFISASAVGFYGNSTFQVSEASPKGSGFLSDVCEAWEAASKSLIEIGMRVAYARFGLVISRQGGILKALLPIFRWGFGGKMGDGKQMMSWVALEDVSCALVHILGNDTLKGPVNIVSPYPVSQGVFAKTLAKLLSKPCFFSVPRFVLCGEKAKELILSSVEAIPMRLQQSGYIFLYPKLLDALQKNLD